MKGADLAELLVLAAVWGGAFLFMRVVAPAFGPFPLAGLRVIGAALVLVPMLAASGGLYPLREHWKPVLLLGVTNSALPFLCFGYAALSLSAGLASIFNAASPLFGALIAWLWLKDRLGPSRLVGLGLGFAGVAWLAEAHATLASGADAAGGALAVVACLVATASYGFSANLAKRHLSTAPPLAVAAGSQLGAAVVMIVPTVLSWPATPPSVGAWVGIGVLAVVCTGFAYVLYFRLIAHVGPSKAIAVTFLVPAFAVAWGAWFLDEALTLRTLLGCAVILLGTALATGVIGPRRAASQ